MIDSLYQLGKFYLNFDLNRDIDSLGILEDFAKEAFSENQTLKNSSKPIVYVINIEKNADNYCYKGMSIEDYKPDYNERYLYRKGSSRGTDISCTSKLTDPSKTIKNKVIAWFENASKSIPQNVIIEHSNELIKENQKNIIVFIQGEIKKDQQALVTVCWHENGKELYPGDIDDFKDLFKESCLEQFCFKHNCSSKASDLTCSLCGSDTDCYGFGFPFSFYTVDNPNFVTGGFNQELSVNNLPLCLKCILLLEKGKEALDKYFHLKYAFGINDCYLFPKLLQPESNQEEQWKKLKRLKIENGITNLPSTDYHENRVLQFFKESHNWVSLGFFFFQKNKEQIEILMYAEDVLPSRLTKIYRSIRNAENLAPDYYKDENAFSLFRILKEIFYRKETDLFKRDYLEVLRSIFMGLPVSYDFMLDRIVNKLRSDFSKGNDERYTLEKSMIVLDFLEDMGILNFKGGR